MPCSIIVVGDTRASSYITIFPYTLNCYATTWAANHGAARVISTAYQLPDRGWTICSLDIPKAAFPSNNATVTCHRTRVGAHKRRTPSKRTQTSSFGSWGHPLWLSLLTESVIRDIRISWTAAAFPFLVCQTRLHYRYRLVHFHFISTWVVNKRMYYMRVAYCTLITL